MGALRETHMWTIVGLGNPGEEYETTRHNTGRIVLEAFRKKEGFPAWRKIEKYKALVSEGGLGKETVRLLEPETFMNRSGAAVAAAVKSPKQAERLAVVHDDLDLPFGKFKISFNKSAGGHRGVESVIKALGTEAFVRVRIGISKAAARGGVRKPEGEAAVADFILKPFRPAELEVLKKISKSAAAALAMMVAESREKAMGEFNGR